MKFRHKGYHEIEQLDGTVDCIVRVDGTLFKVELANMVRLHPGSVTRDRQHLTNKGLRKAGVLIIDLPPHKRVAPHTPVPTIKKGRVVFV
jgi:hypothetical protein